MDVLVQPYIGAASDESDVLQAPAEKTKEAVMTAVKAGYRMLDCANDYDNEHVIGEALKELFAAGVVKREELFVQVHLNKVSLLRICSDNVCSKFFC